MRELHRLGPRVGARLYLEVTRVGVGRPALTRHGNRSYAGGSGMTGGCALSCVSATAPAGGGGAHGRAGPPVLSCRQPGCWPRPGAAGAAGRDGRARRVLCWLRGSQSDSLGDAADLAAKAAALGQVVVAVGGDGMVGALAAVGRAEARGSASSRRATATTWPAGSASRPSPRRRCRVLTAGAGTAAGPDRVATPGRPEVVVAGSVYLGIRRWPARSPTGPGGFAARPCTRWRPCVRWPGGRRPGSGWKSARDGPGGQRLRAGFSGYAVVVANASYFGAGMKVAPGRCR